MKTIILAALLVTSPLAFACSYPSGNDEVAQQMYQQCLIMERGQRQQEQYRYDQQQRDWEQQRQRSQRQDFNELQMEAVRQFIFKGIRPSGY